MPPRSASTSALRTLADAPRSGLNPQGSSLSSLSVHPKANAAPTPLQRHTANAAPMPHQCHTNAAPTPRRYKSTLRDMPCTRNACDCTAHRASQILPPQLLRALSCPKQLPHPNPRFGLCARRTFRILGYYYSLGHCPCRANATPTPRQRRANAAPLLPRLMPHPPTLTHASRLHHHHAQSSQQPHFLCMVMPQSPHAEILPACQPRREYSPRVWLLLGTPPKFRVPQMF